MDTLEANNLGPPVLTLQEAMSSLEAGLEGTMFQMNLKSSEGEALERVIRVRISEVYFGPDKRIILQISDLTDSVNYEKMQLKQKEETVTQIIIGQELGKVFNEQSLAINQLVDKLGQTDHIPEIQTLKQT